MRYSIRRLAIVALVVGSVGALAPTVRGADLATAKDNYNSFCAGCHGESGQGNGPAGATLPVKPRNFTQCAEMEKIPDNTLFKAIKDGGAAVHLSDGMPAAGGAFGDAEVHDLVLYVRGFCKK